MMMRQTFEKYQYSFMQMTSSISQKILLSWKNTHLISVKQWWQQ